MGGRWLESLLLAGSLVLAGCTSSNGTSATAPSAVASALSTTAPSSDTTASRESSPSVSSSTATPTYVPHTVGAGPPSGVAAVIRVQTDGGGPVYLLPMTLAWAKTGTTLFVTTNGSHSCPQVVEAQMTPVSTGPQRITLRTSDPHNPSGAIHPYWCTADLTATTSKVTVPPSIDPTKPVVVTLNGRTYALPGR